MNKRPIPLYLIFFVNIYLHPIGSQIPDGQCPSLGNTSILTCCLNYIDIGGECVACQPGTMGLNCTRRCPDGYYGQFCVKPCDCLPKQRCSKAFGCVQMGGNETPGNKISNEMNSLHPNSCKSLEAAVIGQGVVIGLLVVALVVIMVHLYRQPTPRKNSSGYMNTHIKFEEVQLHSYEAMKGNNLTDGVELNDSIESTTKNRAKDENYLEPIVSTEPIAYTGQHSTCNKQKEKAQVGIYESNDPMSVSSTDVACPPTAVLCMESFKSSIANISHISVEKNESYLQMGGTVEEPDQCQRDGYLDVEPHKSEREEYLDIVESDQNQRENYLDVIV